MMILGIDYSTGTSDRTAYTVVYCTNSNDYRYDYRLYAQAAQTEKEKHDQRSRDLNKPFIFRNLAFLSWLTFEFKRDLRRFELRENPRWKRGRWKSKT